MAITLVGTTGKTWGAVEPRQIVNIPEGAKVRVRIRNDDFVRAFVKQGRKIDHYIVQEIGGAWFLNPAWLQGTNVKN